MKKKIFTLLAITFFTFQLHAQSSLYVDTTITVDQMLMDFFDGSCVTISNTSFTGDQASRGYFQGANTTVGLPGGIVLSSGLATTASLPNNSAGTGTSGNTSGSSVDPDLQGLTTTNNNIWDAAIIEFDLISSTSDSFYFSYSFASEEYPEYVCSGFNDVFGFFVSGPNPDGGNYENENIALIPDLSDPSGLTFTDIPVAINNINPGVVGNNGIISNCTPPNGSLAYGSYYLDNSFGTDLTYDGLTVELLAPLYVVANQTYHIKIAVGDVGDSAFDSAVFLSVESLCGDSLITPPAEVQFSVSGNTIELVNESRYATSYLWDFGDGFTSTERYPAPHTYTQDGFYNLSLTTENYCCTDVFERTIVVGNAVVIDAETCDTAGYPLNGLEPDLEETGLWSIIVGEGSLDDDSDPFSILNNPSIGTNVLLWEITNTISGNVIYTDTFVLQVNEPLQVNITSDFQNVCLYDSPISLMASFDGGVFSGPGVSANSFDPAIAGEGSHIITYEYTDDIGCNGTSTETVEILPLPIITLDIVQTVFCESDEITLFEASPPGGTFEGEGLDSNNFDPSAAGVGIHSITYTFIDNNGCSAVAYEDIEVTASPVLDITSNLDNICEGDGLIELQGTPNGGIFSGTGVSDNFLDPSILGPGNHNITYTYETLVGCIGTYTLTTDVIVNPNPEMPEVSLLSGDSLHCSISGDDYLWALDGNPLSENSQQIPMTGDGIYTVTVIQDGCSSPTSAGFFFTSSTSIYNSSALQILPNPAKEFINIFLTENKEQQSLQSLTIYNAQGKLISNQQQHFVNGSLQLNIKELTTGIYFIRIKGKTENWVGSFLKQ